MSVVHYKYKYITRIIPADVYSSFEVQRSQIDLVCPFCFTVYRPPQMNNILLDEFAALLRGLVG